MLIPHHVWGHNLSEAEFEVLSYELGKPRTSTSNFEFRVSNSSPSRFSRFSHLSRVSQVHTPAYIHTSLHQSTSGTTAGRLSPSCVKNSSC